jgi:hypothetical protein
MGYTHYWVIRRPIAKRAMTKIVADVRKLLAATSVPVAFESDEPLLAPEVSATLIRFNGVGDDGHETFYFTPHADPDSGFCKTNRKPYDRLVTAVLIVIAKHSGSAIEVTSDGAAVDWLPGAAFVKQVLGEGYAVPLAAEEQVQ